MHLHGRLADMTAISDIARRHGLVVIEDAAQAHGAERGGVRAGAFGELGCFSFYPGKNLGACGEGWRGHDGRPVAGDGAALAAGLGPGGQGQSRPARASTSAWMRSRAPRSA